MSGDMADGQAVVRAGVRRPRVLARAAVGWPPALRELKELLYQVYLEGGAPSLDTITAAVADDDELPGAPGRDVIRRAISDPGVPPDQADAVAVARVLARRARWDEDDLSARVRALWVQARMAAGVGRPIGDFIRDDRLVLQDLEIHPAVDSGDPHRFGVLPRYVPRAHDTQLAAVVDAAVAGRSSIAVLVGGSSTGKTRALWEAVRTLPDGWTLWHPFSPTRQDAVLDQLADVAPKTVVWLNEAQFYLSPAPYGEQIAARLRSLLHDSSRGPVLVVATLWPELWDILTTRTPDDENAQARALLEGHRIKVPDVFTAGDLRALYGTGGADPRLVEAAEHAQGAQVTQYLAGVPVLLDRYANAPPATRALIDAAMDARRLGAGPRIPLNWLAEAAPGYLTDTQWDATGDNWLEQALDYVCAPCKGIPGILTPHKIRRPRNYRAPTRPMGDDHGSQGRLYLLADYLDQRGRQQRAETIPPVDFWTAAAHHAHPTDFETLGDAAWGRGLYRDATQLHKNAVRHRASSAPSDLVKHLRQIHPADLRPAQWAATHVSLDNRHAASQLLYTLRKAGAWEQAGVLLARDPAAHVSLDDPFSVGTLLTELLEAGAREQAGALLARDPAAHVSLDDPLSVSLLFKALREAGAREQTAALLGRDPGAHTFVDNPISVGMLFTELREAGAREQADALFARGPGAHTHFGNPLWVAALTEEVRQAGANEDLFALLARTATRVSIDNPFLSVSVQLKELQEAGAHEQVAALLARTAAQVPIANARVVTGLLKELREAGAHEQAAALLARNPAAQVQFDNPWLVTELLKEMREAGAHEQAAYLLARNPAAQVRIDDSAAVNGLLMELGEASAHEQAAVLTARLPAAGHFDLFTEASDSSELFQFGREPDGCASPPWTWDDLH
ncbi:hypothetical protein ACFYRN_43720 [Streptomyces sp. NPDC005227]|uniref:hypothetical protein n=1 Tax=Streptomyces sp. NPDC005227 TaxID=3364707 RepID=UPI00369F1944